MTKSNNSPKAYSSSPTGAGTSRTPLPGPHWKRSSPPLMQVGSAYHKITRPKRQRKDQEGYGKLRKLLRSPPPPSSPAFREHIAEVQSVVNTLRSSDETKATRKLHSSLVRGVQMKSTVARTLCPKDLEALVVRDPATKELLSDPADVAKVYGDTLLHLGGHPDYAPSPGLRRRGPVPLAHMPRFCQERPHTTCDLAGVLNHLQHSKPSKAGGPDKTNNYILALCPEPIQRFFHTILNRFLHSPLPPHWLCAKICLLYKKGDPFPPLRLPSYCPLKLYLQTLGHFCLQTPARSGFCTRHPFRNPARWPSRPPMR